MQLTIVGGGGFRVPQVYRALAGDLSSPIDRLVLTDTDSHRLQAIRHVIAGLAGGASLPEVWTTTDAAAAVDGTDVVVVAIPDTANRALDEEIALRHGLLAHETVGVGALVRGMRTIPGARAVAEVIAERAPRAWVVNLTRPAGMVTRALREYLGDRVIGACDTPVGLLDHVTAAIHHGIDDCDYVGINQLGWLRSIIIEGRDVLPALLEAEETLARIPEARLLGADVVASLGALPHEGLAWYCSPRESLARLRTRVRRARPDAELRDFYDAAAASPDRAAALWLALMETPAAGGVSPRADSSGNDASTRPNTDSSGNDAGARHHVDGGRTTAEVPRRRGAALQLVAALAGGNAPPFMILGVRNAHAGRRAIAQLPDDAVVEVPCLVSRDGVHPRPVAPVSGDMAGLLAQVTGSEDLVLHATAEKDPVLAVRALASHPLVDSLAVARTVLAEYCAADPAIAAAVGASSGDSAPVDVTPRGAAALAASSGDSAPVGAALQEVTAMTTATPAGRRTR